MSYDTTHECPAPGCEARMSSSVLACRFHWYQLSSELRRRVTRTWNSGNLEEYMKARNDAVESLGGTSL